MQEEIDAARTWRQSSIHEINNFISDDLQIDSRFAAGSPIIGLILNNNSHQSNSNDSEDDDFEFEFPIFDRKLLSDAEQIQTVPYSAKMSSSSGGNGSARGSRSIRRWGISFRDMLNRREKSERKAWWFVRLVSSKKTVAEEGEKRRGTNTSSYRIVGFGLFYRM